MNSLPQVQHEFMLNNAGFNSQNAEFNSQNAEFVEILTLFLKNVEFTWASDSVELKSENV